MESIRSFFYYLVSVFVQSESGLVQPQKSLPLAWIIGILTGAAIILGRPNIAAAETCGASEWGCPGYWLNVYCPSSSCTSTNPPLCFNGHEQTAGVWRKYAEGVDRCCCYA